VKRFGGGKRPKGFRTDHIDHERDAKLRAQAEERRIKREMYAPKSFNDSLANKKTAQENTSRPVEKQDDPDFCSRPASRRDKEETAPRTIEKAAAPVASEERPLKVNPERKSFRKKSED
uniref:hypothetical protein n=1 Tax=Halobacteriovorax sp. TaxID=2020862 RepID=UPI003562A646